MNLPERIEVIIRAYPHWSAAERRRMDALVEEILSHLRNGNGNRFVVAWCDKNLGNLSNV